MDTSSDILKITQRQYEIIMRQALENLPRESGGFLGGTDGMIRGLFPVFNKCIENSTDTFVITTDDIMRAHDFFKMHKLEYYGVYHSHPKGLPEPSQQDLRNRQRYHFIIGLANPDDPILAAFTAKGMVAIKIPLQVIDNKGITVLDLQSNQQHVSESPFIEEMNRLHKFIEDIKQERAEYPRLAPINPYEKSDFSTIA
jgi:proteasome lid subunit RPN8/RPN11